MFDMTQCKIGDKLATRGGLVAEFTCDFESGQSPYALALPDSTWWTVYADGRVNKGEEHDFDIIGFVRLPEAAPVATPKITIVAKPSFVLSITGQDVELTLGELKDLGATIINLIGEE